MHIILELQKVVKLETLGEEWLRVTFQQFIAYLGVLCFIPCRLKRLTLFPLN